ncbi:DUF192 domain-containing protein [Escherichia coli]
MRFLLIAAALTVSQPALSKLCTVQLNNGAELTAPVAITKPEQVKGLAGNHTHPAKLIMAWRQPEQRAIWMKDTPLPLTAAFIGAHGEIQSIQNMAPETETAHSSLRPVIAIIEVSPEIAEQLKWKRGDYVTHSSCFAVNSAHKTTEYINDPR